MNEQHLPNHITSLDITDHSSHIIMLLWLIMAISRNVIIVFESHINPEGLGHLPSLAFITFMVPSDFGWLQGLHLPRTQMCCLLARNSIMYLVQHFAINEINEWKAPRVIGGMCAQQVKGEDTSRSLILPTEEVWGFASVWIGRSVWSLLRKRGQALQPVTD